MPLAWLALLPAPVPAQGLKLHWNACATGFGSAAHRVFECNTNDGAHELVVSFVLGAPLDSVIGIEAVIDMQHGDAALPDWWSVSPSGCRSAAVSVETVQAGSGCADTWAGVGVGLMQDFEIGQPRGGAAQARMKVVVAVSPSDSARSLDSGVEYLAARVLIANLKTVGIGACTGCSGSACLVLNSITVRRLPGGGGDLRIEQPAGPGANQVTWQGTATSCDPVPVRPTTWGAIKNLYR